MDNKTILETRQRADELLRQAMLIWRNSDHEEELEGLENDPVFRMLMTTLASEFNGIDNDIESLKQQVMDDFANTFIPYEVNDVMPASLLVETQPAEGVADVAVDGDSTFTERGKGLNFMPLLKTRVLNASVDRVARLDGRRWKVTMNFPEGVTSLDWFTFAIDGLSFRDLFVSCGNRELSIIKPWNQHDLPYNEAFDFAGRMYNQSPVIDSLSICMDVLAKRDICLFCLGEQEGLTFGEEVRSLDFIFEFTGIDDDFVLDKTRLHLNVCLMLNVEMRSVTMSGENPFVRVDSNSGEMFMKLMPPSEEQVFNRYTVYARHVMSDRFNMGSLVRLLDCIRDKFHTDYYAFQMLKNQDGDAMLRSITLMIQRLREMANSSNTDISSGVYLFLKSTDGRDLMPQTSVEVRYLATRVIADDGTLNRATGISAPIGLDASRTRQIMDPIIGDEFKRDIQDRRLLAYYYIRTSDRMVTPADIRFFCIAMLTGLLSIGRDMIKQVTVSRNVSRQSPVGYDIHVNIALVNNTIMRKAVGDSLPRLEKVLETTLAARSINIYPISVTIEMK